MVLKVYFSLGGCAGPVKCQNMSSCQKVKYLYNRGGSQKKICKIRFTHLDINFDVKYEGH